MVAFVSSDLDAGSSRGSTGAELIATATPVHTQRFDAAIAVHGGVVVESSGMNHTRFGAFARCSDALAGAVATQLALGEEVNPETVGVRARVGVHVAEVVDVEFGDYPAEILDRCARLMRAGHGGQVLVSGTVTDLIGGQPLPDVELVDQGEHHLSGMAQAMRIYEVRHPRLPSRFPPLRTLEGSSRTLPRMTSPLIGREADVAEFVDAISNHRLVTLVGAGGCGKTRVAVEVASRQVERLRDGVYWVDLAPVSDRDRVDDATASALSLVGAPDQSARQRVLARLADASCLLVLDNCEHVIDAAADLIANVLERCLDVRVLVTSREPLALHDEVIRRVPSLSLPAADDLASVMNSASGRLLVERIRRIDSAYDPDDGDAEALASICRQLDGIPLALELAAARVRTLPVRSLAARLSERFGLLTGGGRNVLPRQRTLEASVSWSYQLLDERERLVFRRLSIFAGGFTLDAGHAVVDPDLDVPSTLSQLIERLVDRSMLEEHYNRDGARYSMLETLRQFGRERLLEDGDVVVVRDRHLAWFQALTVAAGAELYGPRSETRMEELERELPNFRLAMRWALDTRRGDALATLVASIAWFWFWSGRSLEAREWFDRLDAGGLEVSQPQLLELLSARLTIAGWLSPREGQVEADAAAALEVARALGDRVAEGRILANRGMSLFMEGDLEAQDMIDRGRRVSNEAGDRLGELLAEESLVTVEQVLCRHDRALERLVAIEHDLRALGSRRLLADHMARLMMAQFNLGDYDAVLRAADERRAILGTTTDNSEWSEHFAAMVATHRGHPEVALDRMERVFDRCWRDGAHYQLPIVIAGIAHALVALGRTGEAIVLLEDLWKQPGVADFMPTRFMIRQMRAVTLLADGDLDTARRCAGELLDDALEVESPFWESEAERALGNVARLDGDHHVAEAKLTRVLEANHAFGGRQFVAGTLETIAGLELDYDRATTAATLFGAAASVRAEAGVVLRHEAWQPTYRQDLDATRAALTADEFQAAWASGEAMSLDDAVELALRGRGERGRPTFGWDSLTPAELRVATLAAQGLTNQQIADQLVMGRETAKTHMSRVLRKLDLDNRTQLAATMSQLETTPEPRRKARAPQGPSGVSQRST